MPFRNRYETPIARKVFYGLVGFGVLYVLSYIVGAAIGITWLVENTKYGGFLLPFEYIVAIGALFLINHWYEKLGYKLMDRIAKYESTRR